MKKNVRRPMMGVLGLLAAAALAAATGCEPTDWDRILAVPAPVTGLSATRTLNNVQLDYTLPARDPLYVTDGFRIYFYYRDLTAGTPEVYRYSATRAPAQELTAVSDTLDMTGLLTPGNSYVFVVYNVDVEYQRSVPAQSSAIVW